MTRRRVLIWSAFALSAVCAWAGSCKVHVAPPDGTDDTVDMQKALDDCVAHGPGCSVQLAAGTYHPGGLPTTGPVLLSYRRQFVNHLLVNSAVLQLREQHSPSEAQQVLLACLHMA